MCTSLLLHLHTNNASICCNFSKMHAMYTSTMNIVSNSPVQKMTKCMITPKYETLHDMNNDTISSKDVLYSPNLGKDPYPSTNFF